MTFTRLLDDCLSKAEKKERKKPPPIPCLGYEINTPDCHEYDCRYAHAGDIDCGECVVNVANGGTMDPRTGKTYYKKKTVKEQFEKLAFIELLNHHRTYNPYIDDYPTARHEAAKHRAECEICLFIDKHRKKFNELLASYGLREIR
jgi:hypothetical protein